MEKPYFLCPDVDSIHEIGSMLNSHPRTGLVVESKLQLDFIQTWLEQLFPDVDFEYGDIRFSSDVQTPETFYCPEPPSLIPDTLRRLGLDAFYEVKPTQVNNFYLAAYYLIVEDEEEDEENSVRILPAVPQKLVYIPGEISPESLGKALFE